MLQGEEVAGRLRMAEAHLAELRAQAAGATRLDESERLLQAAHAAEKAELDKLGDLEKVFHTYLDELLPRVLAATTCDALEDALLDIRMEFRELVWHLWYPKSFRNQLLGDDSHPPSIDAKLRP